MKILFVCSGNTCRSPLAAAIMNARLAKAAPPTTVSAESAGTSAWDGAPASEGSYLIALERGLDLSAHRARMLTSDIVQRADLVLAMSPAHADRATSLGGARKTFTLTEFAGDVDGDPEISDPMGGDVADYRATADRLESLIARVVERLHAGNGP